MLLPSIDSSRLLEQLVFEGGNVVDDHFGNVVAFGSPTEPVIGAHLELEPDPAFNVRGAAADRSVRGVRYQRAVHVYLGLAVAESISECAASSSSLRGRLRGREEVDILVRISGVGWCMVKLLREGGVRCRQKQKQQQHKSRWTAVCITALMHVTPTW